MKSLILGGVRSGKTRYAEQQAMASERPVTVVATALALDAEMGARIARHRADRPAHWAVVEEPLALEACLRRLDGPDRVIVVDCLTLWLTQLLEAGEARLKHETEALLAALPDLGADLLLVSNETGLGIMPLGELTRRFGDVAGRLHQGLAARVDRVVLMVAGLPLTVKGQP